MVELCKKWTKDDVREVLNEISDKMGLDCSNVPILFMKSKKIMGQYVSTIFLPDNELVCQEFRFSQYLLDGRYREETVKDVIGHEYIHYYTATTTNNYHAGHNKDFYDNCRKAGVIPEREISDSVIDSSLQLRNHKYDIVCPNCGIVGYRFRIKDIEDYENSFRCAKCKSDIKVVKLH